MPELLGLADRVLVMEGGRIRAEFDRSEASEQAVMQAAIPQGAARGTPKIAEGARP